MPLPLPSHALPYCTLAAISRLAFACFPLPLKHPSPSLPPPRVRSCEQVQFQITLPGGASSEEVALLRSTLADANSTLLFTYSSYSG